MRRVALGLALLAACQASSALAHGGAGGAQLPADVEAVTPQGKKAKAELAALPADETSRALTAEPTKQARLALARAHGAHLAGDTDGALLLSRVALAWTEAATATVRAADAEKKAAQAEITAGELREKILRARALLAETEARKLQLAAELAQADKRARQGGAAGKKSAPEKGARKAEKRVAEPPVLAPRKPPPKAAAPPSPTGTPPSSSSPAPPPPKPGAPKGTN